METIRDFMTGIIGLFVFLAICFVWVGIPIIFMSTHTPEGTELSSLGAAWILFPVVVLVMFVITMFGRMIRGL